MSRYKSKCLYNWYKRNNIEIPDPSDIGGIKIRVPPKNQGSNPPNLWKLLNHDPDTINPFDFGDPVAQAETKAIEVKRISALIAAAVRERDYKLAVKEDRNQPRPNIFEIAERGQLHKLAMSDTEDPDTDE